MLDRRVEITGPTDRKMVINALNCGASTFMADFEDANCPTWHNMIDGQINLRDAVQRTITFEQSGKQYKLNDSTAVLIRGPAAGTSTKSTSPSTADLSPAASSTSRCSSSTTQGAPQARLGPVLLSAEDGVASRGAPLERHFRLRAERSASRSARSGRRRSLRPWSRRSRWTRSCTSCASTPAGLNIGRWDYIFSCIKKFRANKDFCLADRAQVTMLAPFMRAYALLLLKTCHRRNAPAMGSL